MCFIRISSLWCFYCFILVILSLFCVHIDLLRCLMYMILICVYFTMCWVRDDLINEFNQSKKNQYNAFSHRLWSLLTNAFVWNKLRLQLMDGSIFSRASTNDSGKLNCGLTVPLNEIYFVVLFGDIVASVSLNQQFIGYGDSNKNCSFSPAPLQPREMQWLIHKIIVVELFVWNWKDILFPCAFLIQKYVINIRTPTSISVWVI